MEKTILGLIEDVKIHGRIIKAKIDTGAKRSSISRELANELNLGPVIKVRGYKTSTGREKRPVIKTSISIKGRKFKATFNIANRAHMKYRILIGQNILKKRFLIDPSK